MRWSGPYGEPCRCETRRIEEGNPMNTEQLRRAARRVAEVVAEMNEAQRRLYLLRTAQDRYLINPDEPPETYAEFLARTSGPLLREPPASRRAQRGCPR
jgi:hypothetical protein